MPKTHVIYRIQNFLDQPKLTELNLCFDQLDIFSFYQGRFLNVKSRKFGNLVLSKAPKGMARVEVMDQLIFSFTFHFFNGRKSKMLHLSRPLSDGHLQMDDDRFVLHFTIDSPDKDKQVQLCYVYQQLQGRL